MTQAKHSSLNIGREGFNPSQPVSNVNMCHLREFDATMVDGCGIWEHLHSFREGKCLQGHSKALWMGP